VSKNKNTHFEYEKKEFAFVRTEQQIDKIIKESKKNVKLKSRKYLQ